MTFLLPVLAFAFVALLVAGAAMALSPSGSMLIEQRLGELSGRPVDKPVYAEKVAKTLKHIGKYAPQSPSELGKLQKRLVCAGYPFHPPEKPEQLRTAHLTGLACPALIVQGERDPFGVRSEVEGYGLSASIAVHWITDGDHDLVPRKASGTTTKANMAEAVHAIVQFAERLSHAR